MLDFIPGSGEVWIAALSLVSLMLFSGLFALKVEKLILYIGDYQNALTKQDKLHTEVARKMVCECALRLACLTFVILLVLFHKPLLGELAFDYTEQAAASGNYVFRYTLFLLAGVCWVFADWTQRSVRWTVNDMAEQIEENGNS